MRKSSVANRPQTKHLIPGRQVGVKNKTTRIKQQILEGMTLSGHEPVDPREHFLDILSDPDEDPARRDAAAATLLPYYYSKMPTAIAASVQTSAPRQDKATIRRMAEALLLETADDDCGSSTNP